MSFKVLIYTMKNFYAVLSKKIPSITLNFDEMIVSYINYLFESGWIIKTLWDDYSIKIHWKNWKKKYISQNMSRQTH